MKEEFVVPPLADQEFLRFIGQQTFVVDPRAQGYGLREYDFLDGYANKFFLLAGKEGAFMSPREIPVELLEYYAALGIETATIGNITAIPPRTEGGLMTDLLATGRERLPTAAGSYVVPYMLTNAVETIADRQGMRLLGGSEETDVLADKAHFQNALAAIAPDIADDTGFDIAIPSVHCVAGDRASVYAAYAEMSHNGTEKVVLVKPKSASALGIFVVQADQGRAALEAILGTEFAEDESVLVEAYIDHNQTPSMQGARLPSDSYQHLYFGKQITVHQGGRVEYAGSQIPY